MTHWLYVYLANPLGLAVLWRPVIYIGETRCHVRRRQDHVRAPWAWAALPAPVVVPLPRPLARGVERRLVRVLRPAANREYNRHRVTAAVVVGRLAALAALVVVVVSAWP